jgi:hypothetical protein
VPKRNLGSKRKKEKEKEKESKKRGIEPAIGVPRCANRVPITDRAGPGRAGQGTGPVPTWGHPFFSVSRLSLLSARWRCRCICADESGKRAASNRKEIKTKTKSSRVYYNQSTKILQSFSSATTLIFRQRVAAFPPFGKTLHLLMLLWREQGVFE